MHNDAYKSGYDAFLTGLRMLHNPYMNIDGEKASKWCEGWLDAQWHWL